MERQILITVTEEHWDEEDYDWLKERLNGIMSGLLQREDYTIKEIKK